MILPPEIILYIFETLHHAHSKGNRRTLNSCTLVCKAWKPHAQHILFRSLYLSAHHSKLLISGQRGSHILASAVRHLDISIGTAKQDTLHLAHFTRILAYCRSLQELTLRVYGIYEFATRTLREMRCAELGEIKTLALMACDIDSVVLSQMMDVWPSISEVVVGSGMPACVGGWKAQCRLRLLSFFHAPTLEVMQSVLANSQETMKVLELRGGASGKLLESILRTHGLRLQTLRLREYASVSSIVVKYCRRLEEADFRHSPAVPTCYIIPRSVKKIVYRTPTHFTCVNLLPMINTLTSSLNVETFRCDQSLLQHPHFATLMHICKRRDILVEYNEQCRLEVRSLARCHIILPTTASSVSESFPASSSNPIQTASPSSRLRPSRNKGRLRVRKLRGIMGKGFGMAKRSFRQVQLHRRKLPNHVSSPSVLSNCRCTFAALRFRTSTCQCLSERRECAARELYLCIRPTMIQYLTLHTS